MNLKCFPCGCLQVSEWHDRTLVAEPEEMVVEHEFEGLHVAFCCVNVFAPCVDAMVADQDAWNAWVEHFADFSRDLSTKAVVG